MARNAEAHASAPTTTTRDLTTSTRNVERVSWTLDEFCARHGISRSTLRNLHAQGRGPAQVLIGTRLPRITAQAEREWVARLEREQQTATPPRKALRARAANRKHRSRGSER